MVFSLIQGSPEVAFSHIDIDGSLSNPAIICATIISTFVLVLVLSGAIQAWQRLRDGRVGRRILLVLLGCGSYLLIGIIQIVLGETFYRAYERIDPAISIGLYVPVAPVWVLGTVGAVLL